MKDFRYSVEKEIGNLQRISVASYQSASPLRGCSYVTFAAYKGEDVYIRGVCVLWRTIFNLFSKEERKLFPLNSLFDASRGKNVTIR